MKPNRSVYAVLGLLIVLVVFVVVRMSSLSEGMTEIQQWKTANSQLRDSMQLLTERIDSLRSQMPGLGEYMTTIQLHTAKLWFAAKTLNWNLTKFELDELGETMQAAEALRVTRNNVNVSPLLQSVRETQLPMMRKAVEAKELKTFKTLYAQTLEACNGCHHAAGYGFIHVITPLAPPVTNQQWESGAN